MPEGRILVVDDEPEIVELCARVLTGNGYSVQGTTSGAEAIALLEREPFDLLVVDLRMPDVDGLTVLRRGHEIDPHLTAVVVTGFATLDSVTQVLNAGARRLLAKPFNPPELLASVLDAMAQRQRELEEMRVRAQLPILEIAHALMVEADVTNMADRLLQAVVRELGADQAVLMLLDERTDDLYAAATVDLPAEVLGGVRVSGRWGTAEQVLQGAEPVVLDKVADLEQPWPELLRESASTVFVPLRTLHRAIGLFYLLRRAGRVPFTPGELNLLAIIGGQVATALENVRLYEIVVRGKHEWESTFDAISDAISIHDREFRIVRANRALAGRLGVTPEVLVGHRCYEVIHGAAGPPEGCPCTQTWVDGQPHKVEREIPNLDGFFQITTYPFHDQADQLRGVVHVLRDTTTARRLEEELIRSEKLAALGRLVASLAHEINNPLQALRSGFRLLLNRQIKEEKRWQYLEIADREVERLIAIVERILGFYRPSGEQPEPVDIHALLQETIALAGKQLEQSQVRVRQRFAANLPPVEAVADQLKQVFLNIILNAQQAMPAGGELTAATAWNGREVSIAFHDTGLGIPESEIPLLFEPFYTTRPEGSGLGLAISYGIVERHGGRIDVDSKMGLGSTFTVVLPTRQRVEER